MELTHSHRQRDDMGVVSHESAEELRKTVFSMRSMLQTAAPRKTQLNDTRIERISQADIAKKTGLRCIGTTVLVAFGLSRSLGLRRPQAGT